MLFIYSDICNEIANFASKLTVNNLIHS